MFFESKTAIFSLNSNRHPEFTSGSKKLIMNLTKPLNWGSFSVCEFLSTKADGIFCAAQDDSNLVIFLDLGFF